MIHRTHIGPNAEAVNHALALFLMEGLTAATQQARQYCVALPGGKTPESFFRLLVRKFQHAPWKNVHFFFGDERAVGPEHLDSNFRVANEHLFQPLNLPNSQLHRVHGEAKNLELEAQRYAEDIKRTLPLNESGIPQFDLIILGMGPDGHIASLFPDSKSLDETARWVIPTLVTTLCSWRITLSFPILNAAAHMALLVMGENKSNVVGEVLGVEGIPARPNYPVQRLQPAAGIDWFLDHAAAAKVVPK